MKIINQQNNPIISVVCCVHGNERLGLRVFKFFAEHATEFPRVQIILANELAVRRNVRFIDQDLNRSFPGSPHGNNEQRVAHALFAAVRSSEFVLDIHTTTADIRYTPIIINITSGIKKIIRLCDSNEVAKIELPNPTTSLIGSVKNGVSLEFNGIFGRSRAALNEVIRITKELCANKKTVPQQKTLLHINTTIPLDESVPKDAKNFVFSRKLGVYPFLLNERAYRKTSHGLAAKSAELFMF